MTLTQAIGAPAVALLWGAGCSTSDIVARRVADCAMAGTCTPPDDCSPRACQLDRGDVCDGAGPSAEVGDSCAGAEATLSFRFALCSCSDIVSEGSLRVQAASATPNAAHVGANGAFVSDGDVEIGGSLQAGEEISPADGPVFDVMGITTPQAPPPCACEPLALAPLLQARERDNDNAAADLDASALSGFQGAQALALDCGRYFIQRLAGDADFALRVRGGVALFVAGNVELGGTLTIQLESDATLDLFIGGNLRVSGPMSIQAADAPSEPRTRIYVGGTGTLDFGSPVVMAGTLYAPGAELVTRGELEIDGAMLVRRAALGAATRIDYATDAWDGARCQQALQ